MLADEINRAPAKTQAALLEAMQERQTTADGVAHALPTPFLVIATQNPIESEGTYPLPEAQLDRFILRTTIGLPERADEVEIVRRRLERGADEVDLRCRSSTEGQFHMVQRCLEQVEVDEAITGYVVDLIRATRAARELAVGASPRGSLAVVKLARARAVIAGRDFVTPDDVKEVAVPALAHRVVLTPEAWARRVDPITVVAQADPFGPGAVVALIQPRRDRRALGYATLAIGFIVARPCCAASRMDLALAAPFAAVLILGLRSVRPIEVIGRISFESATSFEGDEVHGPIEVVRPRGTITTIVGRQPAGVVGRSTPSRR